MILTAPVISVQFLLQGVQHSLGGAGCTKPRPTCAWRRWRRADRSEEAWSSHKPQVKIAENSVGRSHIEKRNLKLSKFSKFSKDVQSSRLVLDYMSKSSHFMMLDYKHSYSGCGHPSASSGSNALHRRMATEACEQKQSQMCRMPHIGGC